VVQMPRWMVAAVVIVALAVASVGVVYLTHPSGIVVSVRQGQAWQIYKEAPNHGDDPVMGHPSGPVASGVGTGASVRVRLGPGRYWLHVLHEETRCGTDDGFRVVAHRWTATPDKFAAPSCAIQ